MASWNCQRIRKCIRSKKWGRFRDESNWGIYGKKDDILLEVVEKEENKKLVTRQTQGPFKRWESVQEFHNGQNNYTPVTHTIDYELPTTGKIGNFCFVA